MIRDWLSESQRGNHAYRFQVIDLTESTTRGHKDFPFWLASELLFNYKEPGHLKRTFSKRDKQELKDYITTHLFPPLNTTLEKNNRRGDWGEIITGLVLRDMRQLETTLIKLRYKISKKKSSFGIDVFGVQTDAQGKVAGLCICETKTKITYDKQIGCKAYNSLIYNDTSAIISIADHMATIYFNSQQFDLADQFDEIVLQKANFPTDHHIFLVHEKNLWSEDILVELSGVQNLIQGLNVNIILIDKLDELFEQSNSRVAEVGEDYVYGTT